MLNVLTRRLGEGQVADVLKETMDQVRWKKSRAPEGMVPAWSID